MFPKVNAALLIVAIPQQWLLPTAGFDYLGRTKGAGSGLLLASCAGSSVTPKLV
jgi:hypothetical protein